MKNLTAILIFWLSALLAIAQQKPHYTQYFQNMAVLNPAITGVNHSVTVMAGLRNQWLGFENAPKTSYLTVNMPINTGNSQSGFVDYGVTEPPTRDDRDDYEASYSHHGVGALALSDKTGPLSRTTFNLTYAYHININDMMNLATGVGVGINQVSLNTEELRFKTEGDLVVGSGGNLKKITPDLNAGIYLYGSSFYISASVQQVLNQSLSFGEGYTSGKEKPHYFAGGGYRIWLNNDFSLTPSLMLKYIKPLPFSYDVNAKLAYRNNFWMGLSVRHKDSSAAMMGFTIAKTATLGYAFEYTNSKFQSTNSGSHEIVLGLNF